MNEHRVYTLREIAEKMKTIYPELEWVTFDGTHCCGFSGSERPSWLVNGWFGGLLFLLKMEGKAVRWSFETEDGSLDYSKAIWGFEEFKRQLTEDTIAKDKHTSRKKGVIAYCADGSTIYFDTFKECKAFYDLRSVSDVRDAIDNAKPMPDGTTFLDEATDEDFLKDIFGR